MKNLFAVVVATTSLLVTGVAWAQSGSMMNGGMGMGGWMGGNGGYWMPILLVVVVALVVWVII